MERRKFIAGTAALLVSPRRSWAQGTPRRIGFLGAWADEPARDPVHAAWLSGLREKGWIEGKNLLVEYRFAQDRLPALAAELVALTPELIIAAGPQTALALKSATAPAVEKAEIDRAKRRSTESLDAYALYLRGLDKYYQFTRQANDEALRLFNSAIDLDPNFASAYGRAAYCHAYAKTHGWFSDTPNEIVEVTRLAQRAVELGKDDAFALAASGFALAHIVRDLGVGAGLIDRALVLNSNLAEAWFCGGWAKLWLGEPELAIERFARAMRLSPVDPSAGRMRNGTAYAYFLLGRYDDTASWAAMALQDNPDFQPGLRLVAASNAMAGRLEQAHKAMARLRQLNPGLRVSNLKDVLGPYQHAEDLARYGEGLRQAGLPE